MISNRDVKSVALQQRDVEYFCEIKFAHNDYILCVV